VGPEPVKASDIPQAHGLVVAGGGQDVPAGCEGDRGNRGSPTVLIDGEDPFADPDAPVGLACRVYPTADELAGAPSVAQLTAALRARSCGGGG
jgi:hypothetical protein